MPIEWKDKHYPEYAPSARCKVYPFFGYLMDCDGDCTDWSVSRHKEHVAGGSIYPDEIPDSYETDIDYAKSVIETEIRKLAEAEIAKLEAHISELRNAIAE